MLSYLKVSNLAILDEICIEPGPGLNVLTGETGAGKSIVVDAIGLVLGERGTTDLIRTGEERLVVEAQFDLAGRPDLPRLLEAAGIEPSLAADELIIRRELPRSGRGRAQVNGRLVPVGALRQIGDILADVHGQHQNQSLLGAEGQRDALDLFAGTLPLRREVGCCHDRYRDLLSEKRDLLSRERERARTVDILSRQIEEIDKVDPREDEQEELLRQERILRHSQELAELADTAQGLLSEQDDSALDLLGAARDRLSRLAEIDSQAAGPKDLIQEAILAVQEASRGLSGYAGQEEADPDRLEAVAARLADLERLRRKYGGSLPEVLEFRHQAAAELASLEGASDRLSAIEGELEEATEAYSKLAGELTRKRRRAARRLERAIEKELEDLAMSGTRVSILLEPLEGPPEEAIGPWGMEAVRFLLAANEGEEPRSLARTASGGELSRLMLALRNAGGGSGDRRTLVFDEVDAGIGGRVAEVVGQRLSRLARDQQVFCVTHLPQIAAFAGRHFRVSKRATGGRTRAEVRRLGDRDRLDELARMLGGAPSSTARRHAEALVSRTGRSSA